MKYAYGLIALVLLSTLSFGYYHLSASGRQFVIKFDHYPVFNITYLCNYNGVDLWRHIPYASGQVLAINCRNVSHISYDNSTWIKVVSHKLGDNGILTISGSTEPATICKISKGKGNNTAFWDDPSHCFSRISVYVDGHVSKSVFANYSGLWSINLMIPPGMHTIKVVASDPGGNTANESFVVDWNASTTGMLSYYLSQPQYIALVWVVILFFVVLIALMWRGEKKRAERIRSVKKALEPLFDKEAIFINKFGSEILENPEYLALVKQILNTDPFYSFLQSKKRSMPKDKNDLREWFETNVEKPLYHMLLDHDPNFKRVGSNAITLLLPAYAEIAKKLLRGD